MVAADAITAVAARLHLPEQFLSNERKRKGSGCEADIYFSCAINERTAMRKQGGIARSAGS